MIIPNIYEFGKENADYKELYNLLITKLPDKIGGWNSKDDFNKKYKIPTAIALEKCKWIDYNHNWINLLIFDIDNKTLSQTLEIALKLDLEPSFACSTDKGCQLFYYLDKPIRYEWENTVNWVRDIKRALTHFLDGDKLGSHKLKEKWRNPLQNPFYYAGASFRLNDFDEVLKKYNDLFPKVKKPKSKIQKINTRWNKYKNKAKRNNGNFDFTQGNRNNWLWYMGMAETRKKNYSEEKIISLLNDLQANHGTEWLESIEIKRIAKSIKDYNDKDKNFITKESIKPTKPQKPRNEGIMALSAIPKLSDDDFKEEVKKRKKLGAEYTNKIINQSKEKQMTREQHCLEINQIKEDKNRKLIESYIYGLYADEVKKKNGKWNIVKIADAVKLSRITITKHLKDMGEI